MAVSRLFKEIGADVDRLADSLRDASANAEKAGLKLTAAGQRVVTSFERALNPTQRLAEEIRLLEATGKSTGDIWRVYGVRMKEAAAAATQNGRAVDPLIKKHIDLNAVTEKGTSSLSRWVKGLGNVQKAMLGAGIAIGASQIIRSLVGIGKAALDMAMDAVESENLFAVSMGSMAEKAADWSRQLSRSLGINQYELRKNIGTFNVMFGSMGMGADKAYEMSAALTELAYDMASFYNLPVEEAFDKLRSGITGETEPLKRLGILVDETTTKHYAWKTGMVEQGKELAQQDKLLARYGSILEQTSKAHGDLARTMESPANQLRVLNSRSAELQTTLGMALLPTMVSVTSELTGIATGAGASNEGLQYLAKVIGFPVMAFNVLGRSIAEVRYNLAKFDLWLKEKNPFESDYAKKYSAKVARDAAADVLEYDEKIRKLEASVEALGKFDYKAAAAAAKLEAEQRAAAAAAAARANETARLRKEIESSLRPMDELGEKMAQQIALGYSHDDIIRAYADEIVRAAEVQTQLGGALSDSQRELLAQANTFLFLSGRVNQAKLNLLELKDILGKPLPKELLVNLPKPGEISDITSAIGGVDDGVKEVSKAFGDLRQEQSKSIELQNAFGNSVSTTLTNATQTIAEEATKWMGPIRHFAKAALSALLEGFLNPFYKILAGIGNAIGQWAFNLSSSLLGAGGIPGFTLKGALKSALGIGGSLGASALGGSTVAAQTSATLGAGMAGASPTFIGGGAGGAAAGGGFLGSLAAVAPYAALAIPAVFGGMALANWAKGPNSYQAGAKEVKRDYGLQFKPKDIASFFSGIGVSEPEAWGQRAPLLMSPQFQQFAIARGQTSDMSKFGPEWEAAYEKAMIGNWGDYNELFLGEMSKNPDAIQMPDWYDRLTIPGQSGRSAEEQRQAAGVNVRGGDMNLTIHVHGGDDLVTTVKNKVIPILRREMEAGNTGLRESIRLANARTQGAY